jgi:AmiR/NasT family two-component response regulator
MTREEAIRLIGWLKCTTNREDDLEAIDMAIEALSAEAEYAESKPEVIITDTDIMYVGENYKV